MTDKGKGRPPFNTFYRQYVVSARQGLDRDFNNGSMPVQTGLKADDALQVSDFQTEGTIRAGHLQKGINGIGP